MLRSSRADICCFDSFAHLGSLVASQVDVPRSAGYIGIMERKWKLLYYNSVNTGDI